MNKKKDPKAAKQRSRRVAEATAEEAKVVWDSLDKPSYRGVQRYFEKLGRHVPASTVYLWAKSGWVTRRGRGKPVTPLEDAQERIDGACHILTDASEAKFKQLVATIDTKLGANGGRPGLETLTDLDLLRATNRRAAIVCSLLLDEIDRQKPHLVMVTPKEFGDLIKAAAVLVDAVNGGFERFATTQDRLMKNIIEPQRIEKFDHLAEAAKMWQQPMRSDADS